MSKIFTDPNKTTRHMLFKFCIGNYFNPTGQNILNTFGKEERKENRYRMYAIINRRSLFKKHCCVVCVRNRTSTILEQDLREF